MFHEIIITTPAKLLYFLFLLIVIAAETRDVGSLMIYVLCE